MIYWLHDYRLKDWLGGAQLTTQIMLKQCPYDIEMMYPNQFSRGKLDGNLIIISNCGLYKRSDLQWVIDTQRYIKYERDIAFCDHRHAIGHNCRTDCKNTLTFYTKMFDRSVLNIFLSPLQGKLFFKYMPNLDRSKVFYSPSPIEVDRFLYDLERDGPKEEMYLAVGGNTFIKGTDLIRQEFAGKNLVVLGEDKKIPQSEMPSWYKRAKYFVHKPRVVEGFCRAAAEAYCASCELIVNNKVGFTEYGWDFNDREYVLKQLVDSPKLFWEKVGGYL